MLTWLRDYVNPEQYVIIDGGSKDDTVDKIIHFIKNNNVEICLKINKMPDSFSEQRNLALSYCRSDWVLQIDADETYSKSIVPLIRDIREGKHSDVFGFVFPTANLIGDENTIHTLRGAEPHLRLFRKDNRVEYCGAVHEHISHNGTWVMKGVEGFKVIRDDNIALKHYSLLKSDDNLQKKGIRYLRWAEQSKAKSIPLSGEKYFIELRDKVIKEADFKEIPKEWI